MELNTSNNNKKKMTVINGSHFSNMAGFYEEVSQLFMKDEDWKVGTLDGFNDILYGFHGEIIWKNPKSREKIWVLIQQKNFIKIKFELESLSM
jgi:RNAse (barnase) inhibitor barstar